MRKETLEEAAERLYPIHIKSIIDKYDDGITNVIGEEDINEDNRKCFIEGAKWQQYSNEEKHIGHTINEFDKTYIEGFYNGAKWQQEQSDKEIQDLKNRLDIINESTAKVIKLVENLERSYSEEDLEEAFKSGFTNCYNNNNLTFGEWFEQFKNK